MFSSLSSYSIPIGLPRFLSGNAGNAVAIKSVSIHDIETKDDPCSRALKHLLKLNHVDHSILYHNLEFHNHIPHILGSAYLTGSSPDHLDYIYEEESKGLEKWQESPGEVSRHDWRDFLGDRRYQRAYLDFFEDELVLSGYSWRKVLDKYLFEGKEPLINCVIAGLGHPLIHLGYAYELSSRELAMEALGLAATSYNFLHKYLDQSSYTRSPIYSTQSPLKILERVAGDDRLNGIFGRRGPDNITLLFHKYEDIVLEHWNSWQILNPTKQFEDSQYTAAAMLVATRRDKSHGYDFFLVHLLTTSHAVRIILPLIPAKYHIKLVRQWWLFTLAVYIAQLRPTIILEHVLEYNLNGKDWSWVEKQMLEGSWATDAHYVKALRAMKEAAQVWGHDNTFYLKAAAQFEEDFTGWDFQS